jgi:protein TonB
MPRLLSNPAPRYPAEALTGGVQGVVLLRVRVGADGRVVSAGVYRSSGVAALDEAALDAIRRWRFTPARRRGVPVAREVAVPVRFTIRGR